MNMPTTPSNMDDIINAVDLHHEQYMAGLRLLHEATTRNLGSGSQRPSISGATATSTHMERSGSEDRVASPVIAGRAITFQTADAGGPSQQPTNAKRVRRLTGDSQEARRILSYGGDKKPRSVYDGESDSEDASSEFLPRTPARTMTLSDKVEKPMSYVHEHVTKETFFKKDLAEHLRSLDPAKEATTLALDDVWVNRAEIDEESVLDSFEPAEDGPYMHATYEVYEVGEDGLAERMNNQNGDEPDEVLDASTVWDTIREVNVRGDAVGRMTILQEPSPLMLGAAHMTMGKHFDMDEIFSHLVSTHGNKGKTRAYVNRAFEKEPLRQRSFFFVFKYYTVVGEGLIPPPWLAYDSRPPDRRSPDHIDITECSSVLALSLEGDPAWEVRKKVRQKDRNGKPGIQKGDVYDIFAPWHLLSIQAFPDEGHSMRSEDARKPFYSGPYAFLDSLCMEYRDAVKRYAQLNEMITKLITPPNQFMFDSKLRDKLLFEDKDFTYSRRYFWAYNTLGVINDGIKSMMKAYSDTFDDNFWGGRHHTIWPHPNPDSGEGRDFAVRMDVLRQELVNAVNDLQEANDKNEKTRREIRSLREQLFSGSSVKESRRAIEQGDNIKILTGISMIFLPLTFVTGVFGITTLDIGPSNWQFPVTMVAVCVPFFLFIFMLQTRMGMETVKKCGRFINRHNNRIFGRHGNVRSGGGGGGGGGHTNSGLEPGGGDGSGGGEPKRRFRPKQQKPAIKRTQSGMHPVHRRNTGASMGGGGGSGGEKVPSWSRFSSRMKMPVKGMGRWWGGGAGGGDGAGVEGGGQWWWQRAARRRRQMAGPEVTADKEDSNV
ncbi:hypothetical protein B0H66DRAFT_175982 [Apodospora peruviana]|uniref:Uncharacterized protein n=1 Tax=Apodospora peruviana TaxID=516989 RepID=A0AAE0IAK8_9PEZI|nr:hypothetical protein B0H66DRAFT_175982 [Apodospora peruviana]